MRFITNEKVVETPKQIDNRLKDLTGKIQSILDNNYLFASFDLR